MEKALGELQLKNAFGLAKLNFQGNGREAEMKANRFSIVTMAVGIVIVGACAKPASHPPAMAPGDGAALKSLELSVGKVSPGFSPGRTAYQAKVGQRAERITVFPKTIDADASVSVNGRPVTGGRSSGEIDLPVGRTIVSIEVTSRDGIERKTYTVKVIRAYPTPDWVRLKEKTPWTPRDSAGELVFHERMWLLGGYIPEVINDVWSSPDGEQWTRMGTVPCAAGVNIPVNFVFDDRMWVVCNDGQLYATADGTNWALVTDRAPWKGRYAAGGVVFAGRMWVMGGPGFNDIWSSGDGVDWTLETAHAPWSRRQLFSMLQVLDGRIWLLGGGITVYHPFKAYRDVWNSADGKNWTRVSGQAPWPARIWSPSAVYRNRLWVFGGFRSEPTWNNFNDVWYSSDGVGWSQLETENIWSPRHELSAYVFRDKLWVVGGNSWPLQNDVWYLEIPGLAFLSQPVIEEFVNAQYLYPAHADFNRSRGPISYRLIEAPAWLSIDQATGGISGTPPAVGDAMVTVEAFDAAGETARQTYTLHVIPM